MDNIAPFTILIAEDETDIRNLLRMGFEDAGYRVVTACDGMEALQKINAEKFDIAVLDVMMPRLDGFNLLCKIRATSTVPVIFLTARSDDMDKILGLGLGADDYLVKPFSMSELIARTAAHIRRNKSYQSTSPANNMIKCGSLSLDKEGCCLYKDGVAVELNAKEYKLTEFLMSNSGRVFTKRQLYNEIWDDSYYYDDNTVMVHISHLRNKIEQEPQNPEYIITVRGIGYKFRKS